MNAFHGFVGWVERRQLSALTHYKLHFESKVAPVAWTAGFSLTRAKLCGEKIKRTWEFQKPQLRELKSSCAIQESETSWEEGGPGGGVGDVTRVCTLAGFPGNGSGPPALGLT